MITCLQNYILGLIKTNTVVYSSGSQIFLVSEPNFIPQGCKESHENHASKKMKIGFQSQMLKSYSKFLRRRK